MFVEAPVLAEMILRMLPPPPRAFGPLLLSEVKREAQALGCPSCGDPMKPTTIHEIELEHCAKHGVWFDQDELRLTLYRVADPAKEPPFAEWIKAPEPWQKPRKPRPAPKPESTARVLVWEVMGKEVVTQAEVVKIGRLSSATISIDDDSVSRLHAVVEVSPTEILLIDLGSTAGTYVNGERVQKVKLQEGDFMRIGIADIHLRAT
jgi:Zn-finger nucleic acid-binding protein